MFNRQLPGIARKAFHALPNAFFSLQEIFRAGYIGRGMYVIARINLNKMIIPSKLGYSATIFNQPFDQSGRWVSILFFESI